MRNLKNLGFRVPLAIVNKAHQANQLYPFAISLIESVRTYERTLEKVRYQEANSVLNNCNPFKLVFDQTFLGNFTS